MARKIRADIRVGSLEKKLGLPKGSIRDPKTGRNTRDDATLKSLRKKAK